MRREKLRTPYARTIGVLVVLIAGVVGGEIARGVTARWQPAGAGPSNWFTPTKWDVGVPNGPGDVAILHGNIPNLTVSAPIILGGIEFQAPGTQTITGLGPIVFDNPGEAPALMRAYAPRSGAVSVTLETPIRIAEGEELKIDVATGGQLMLIGGINSAGGDASKHGIGQLWLTGGSLTWDGSLSIDQGMVHAVHAGALGTSAGVTSIKSGGSLQMNESSAESFRLEGGNLYLRRGTHSGSIHLAEDSEVGLVYLPNVTSQNFYSDTELSGVISGPGDLSLRNESSSRVVTLSGDSNYTGHTRILKGEFTVNHGNALGSSAAGTTLEAGTLRINVATAEPIRVNGGVLRLIDTDLSNQGPVTLAGGAVFLPSASNSLPIIVDGNEGRIYGSHSFYSWTGGTTGMGNLHIGGGFQIDAPLRHEGDTVFDGPQLNVANFYTGDTTIEGNVTVNHAGAFGTATTPIVVTSGELLLNVSPAGLRDIDIRRGTLNVPTEREIDNAISLGGDFSATIKGKGIYSQPIDYVTTPGGGDAWIAGGTFNSPIRGNSQLSLGGETVVLNAANEIENRVYTSGGTVIANHADALDLPAVLIQGGVLQLNGPAAGLPTMTRYPYGLPASNRPIGTLRLTVDQEFDQTWFMEEGILEVATEISFQRVISENSRFTSSGGGKVAIDGELLVVGNSYLSGKIVGEGEIRLAGNGLRVSGDQSGFTGDYVVKNGTLSFGRVVEFTAPYSISPQSVIHVHQGGIVDFGVQNVVIHNDIFLHNVEVLPSYSTGPLRAEGNGIATLAGLIDIGEVGSTLSSDLIITGKFRGRNLSVKRESLDIQSRQDELGGDLRIADASVYLRGSGSLHGLDTIIVEKGGVLEIANTSPSGDRVEDSTVIRSRGGRIGLYNHQLVTGSETLGTLILEQGRTELLGRPESPLYFTELDRRAGSIVAFSEHASSGGVGFLSAPPLANGMLGPWAITETGFATLAPNGTFSTLAATSTDLNTATTADHVSVAGSLQLASDRTIASLNNRPTGNPELVDLGGHQLTIASGGIYQSHDIVNGVLTAGNGGPAELVIHNTHRIGADIVDNGSEGSIALVVAGKGQTLVVEGTNTYTGGTWVVGESHAFSTRSTLRINDLKAIPEGDRIHVDYGVYDVRLATAGIVKLSELHVRGGGGVYGVNATFDADAFYFEDGEAGNLTGDGTVYKDTKGEFAIGGGGIGYTGNVFVRDGILRIDRLSIPNGTLHVEGGRVSAGAEHFSVPTSIVLDGGELLGYYNGPIEVKSDSSVFVDGFSISHTLFYGSLSGNGDLTIRGSLDDDYISDYVGFFGESSQYTGDIHVESGALRIGAPAQLGPGEIHVQEGARLILGSSTPREGQTFLDRDIHLFGGTLYATPPEQSTVSTIPNGIVLGDVYIHGEAFVGARNRGQVGQSVPGLVLAGNVILDDEASVFGRTKQDQTRHDNGVALVEISGTLKIGKNNTWHMGITPLAITGSIQAATDGASIDFQGVRGDLRAANATIVATPGRSLAITFNGKPFVFELAGSDSGLSGEGTIGGDFNLDNGAIISPGNSPGLLTIDGDLTMTGGSRLAIEIGGTTRGDDFDTLVVTGALDLQNALLDVSFLDGFQPTLGDTFSIVEAGSLMGRFANVPDSIRVGNYALELNYGPNGLEFTTVRVPEPATVAVTGLLILGVMTRRLRGRV